MKQDLRLPLNVAATLVRQILPRVKELEWRAGPTGVFSIALSDFLAINVFDQETAVERAADYHSHWYDFHSTILAGKMEHFRYALGSEGSAGIQVFGQKAGLDHKPCGKPFRAWLNEIASETYGPGDSYEITAPEIHRVAAEPGTVTLVTRQYKTSPDGYYIFKRPGAAPKTTVPRDFAGFIELGLAAIEKTISGR